MLSKKTGNRLFVSLTPFEWMGHVPEKVEARQSKFRIRYGTVETDSVDIVFPKGYKVKSCPRMVSIDNKFGKCSLKFEHYDGGIRAVISCRYEGGDYDPSDFEAFRRFASSAAGVFSSKIVLIPKM